MNRAAAALLCGICIGCASAAVVRLPVDVIDGDTIRLANEVVRLEGIDAPESRQECRDAAGRLYACGLIATSVLSDLIGDQAVTCDVTGRDRYDRALGTCHAGPAEINSEMVRSGWALAFRRYSDRYVTEEAEAERRGTGMWAGSFEMPWDWRATRGGHASPEGCQIKGNISSSGERIYHMPFHEYYGPTRINEQAGEMWFCTEEEALRAGWRRALR